ncbi:MAG: cytochrome C, class I [Chromatiales bacterium]|nr:cytochrome C, class I [Chromatiales bacterium]
MSQGIATALLVALGASTGTALAADPTPGRLLASQCSQCHGTDGNAISGIPALAGKSANSILKQLRRDMRSTATPKSIMDLQARGYSDEQLRLIAERFAAQPRSPTRPVHRHQRTRSVP